MDPHNHKTKSRSFVAGPTDVLTRHAIFIGILRQLVCDDDVTPILEGRSMGAIFADSPGPDDLTTVERLHVAYDCR
jgi:hypothetical protein